MTGDKTSIIDRRIVGQSCGPYNHASSEHSHISRGRAGIRVLGKARKKIRLNPIGRNLVENKSNQSLRNNAAADSAAEIFFLIICFFIGELIKPLPIGYNFESAGAKALVT